MGIFQLKSLNDNKTIVYEIQSLLRNAVYNLYKLELETHDIEITEPKDSRFGDLTSNIALQIQKIINKNPREIAESLKSTISHQYLEKIEVAGPGFLNFYLTTGLFLDNLRRVLSEKENYGRWELGGGKIVLNEFGSPNAFKSLTVGHLRNAITGLSLSRILEFLGYKVVRLNYYSDIGMHVAKSIYMFLKKNIPSDFEQRPLYERMNFIVSCYVEANKLFTENEDVKKEIQQINLKIFSKEDKIINEAYNKLLKWSLEHQHKDFFARIGVDFDREYSESQMSIKGIELAKKLEGTLLIRDDDALVFPGEKYGVNRYVFLSKFGTPTYSAKDMALAIQKKEDYPNYHFSIVLTSVEQSDYFKTLIKALCEYDNSFKDKYYHLGYGWLLGPDGKKTSTRKGNTVNAVDFLNEAKEYSKKRITEEKQYSLEEIENISEKIGISGLKFLFLSHEFHKDIIYNPDVFLDPQGFSGPYVLYAYVRAKSILRESGNEDIEINLDLLKDYSINVEEQEILKLLLKFEQITLQAGKNIDPHLIANYVFELAQSFNKFYKNHRVIVDEIDQKLFRLALTKAVSIVLANGMYLLGIETIEKM